MKFTVTKPRQLFLLLISLFLSSIAQGQYCTTGLYLSGCASFGDYIQSFSTTGGTTNITNNNTNCANGGGYTDYTTMTHTAMQGQTVNFSLLVSTTLTAFDFEGFKIYVDWNNDQDWLDPGEEMYTSPLLGVGATQTGSFIVPPAAAPGTKRMRVRMCYNETTTIDPCNISATVNWGETEDYSFIVTSACTAPSGLAATAVTATSASLNWGAVAGSQGYEYSIGTSSTPPTGAGTATSGTSYNAGPLTPATTYYFFVRNKCSATAFSTWTMVSFTTSASCVAPTAPVISSITTTSATATWGAVAGSTGYQWFLSTSSTPPASGNATTTTTQNLGPLTSGTQYYFHVRNVCTGGLYSAWMTTPFTSAYDPCMQPSNLTVSNINFNGATISWNAVAVSSGYEWVVTTSPTPPASGTASATTTVNAGGLTGGTLYYVHVRNNCGPGGFSPWTTTTFTTSSSCTVPSNIVITNVTPESADIQWDPVPGAVGFEYIIDNLPSAPGTAGAAINFHRYSPANLVSGTRYFVHLRTNCGSAGGFSSWVTVQFVTDTVCFAPVPMVVGVYGTSADITWKPEANAQNYQYYLTTNINPPYSGYATTATSYTAKGLQRNTQYYMHLRSYCGGNDISAWRSAGFVTNEKTTGVASVSDDAFIDVYPNPVTDVLTIKLAGIGKIDGMIVVSDITGRTVKTMHIGEKETRVDMSSLPGGVYMLKYTDADHDNNFKVLKK